MSKLPTENVETEKRFKRIKRLKKILRNIPRKTSMHKYPFLRRFADVARNRAYLWSFRVVDVVPSLYVGCVLTLTPIPSFLQVIIAFLLALVIRSNAMILMGLQLLSNPITFLFLWSITYKTGAIAVSLLGGHAMQSIISETYAAGLGHIGNYGRVFVRWLATIMFGAMILGTICGFILSTIYKLMAKRAKRR